MICAVFGENRVTLRGHAGYAPPGEDIVCAAASALVFALIGALEEKGLLRELVVRPGFVTVAAEGDCQAEWQLIRCGLGQLAGKYPAELPFPQQKKSPHCRGSAGAGPPISRIGAANPVAAGAGSGGQRI